MKKINIQGLIMVMLCLIAQAGIAQKKKQKQDVEAILGMCGCYEINFNFAETFGENKDYQYQDNYVSGGLEWAFPVVKEKDRIVIQHLLVINDSTIVKHWRQDWLYENRDLYVFDQDNTWKFKQLPVSEVKGQWTQKVYQVDDGPRYEGSATWVHADGRHYWESVADAPLPRRERTKRKDYNVMTRRNRHELTDYGWVHEQDNDKVVRGTSDHRIAREKGWNEYRKVEDDRCAPAVKWWGENNTYWAVVRSVWGEVFATKSTLAINMKVDGQVMFMRLFALGKALKDETNQALIRSKVREVMRLHLKEDLELASR